jgi:hypothetical protein
MAQEIVFILFYIVIRTDDNNPLILLNLYGIYL